MKLTKRQLAEAERLANAAFPIETPHDDDWGSTRQIEAQNAFTTFAGRYLSEDVMEEVWYKATTVEGIEGTLKALRDLRWERHSLD